MNWPSGYWEETDKKVRVSTRAFFCIDASAYLILDIALFAVLPDRAGRIALDVENTALYNAKKLRTNLETSQTKLYHHDFFFFFKQKNLETYNCEVTKIFF